MEELSQPQIQHMIYSGIPIRGFQLKEFNLYNPLLFKQDNVLSIVCIEDCAIDSIDFTSIQFTEEVVIRNCTINLASFHGTFFLKGLTIERCVFNNVLHFQCGGHNEILYPVRLINNTFNGFVDFFDVWFMGPVEIKHCSFLLGTNLLCDLLAFDIEVVLENNVGNLRLDSHQK